jgi:mannose-1-phosphate guanylyltransferase
MVMTRSLGPVDSRKRFSIASNESRASAFGFKARIASARASKDYYWNAGEFVWRADALLAEIKKYCPDISKHLERLDQGEDIKKVYEDMPKIAIDYAIAEKSTNFLVVHGDINWTDIGDWKEVWEI